MKSYYYFKNGYDGEKRYLTLKRPAVQWLNHDAPSVFRSADDVEIYHGWSLDAGLTGNETEAESELFCAFFDKSKVAFRKWADRIPL